MVYFWLMDEWLPRAIENQDGISFFLFVNLLVLVNMQRSFSLGLFDLFKRLLRSYQVLTNTTFPFFHFLHIGSLVVAVSGFSFWFLTFLEVIFFKSSLNPTTLLRLATIGFLFVAIRAFFIKYMLHKLGHWKNKRSFLFSNLFNYFYVGLLLLILLLLYHYSFTNTLFFSVGSSLIFTFWLFLEVRLLFQYLIHHPKEIIYIIFYLCSLKLAPWLWIYKQLF